MFITHIQVLKIGKVRDKIRDGSTQLVGTQKAEYEVSKEEKNVKIRVVDIMMKIIMTHTDVEEW